MNDKLRQEIEDKAKTFDRQAFAAETSKLRVELAPLKVDTTQLLREDRDR